MDGIQKVEVFQTSDGNQHVSIDRAMTHNTDRACSHLEGILASLEKDGRLTRADSFRIITTIFPDYQSVVNLAYALNNIVQTTQKTC